MKKESATNLIILICVIAGVGAALYFFVFKKKTDARLNQEAGAGEEKENIPEELQKSISGFDEGETVTVSGIKYIKQTGQWKVV